MMRSVIILALAMLLSSSSATIAQPIKKAASPLDLKAVGTGALVDLSKSPVAALFELQVLANTRLTWVERAQVDKVVAELELQALFSPEAGRKRAGLGKLLKADLLVMLRAGQSPEAMNIKYLEIVVCESQRGLRLAGQQVPLSGKADVDLKALQAVLDGALAKLAEKITDVCAVPPFLNNDLDFRHDHLKAAFARVVGQHLLQRKGVLLVELAEAQSIAREAILSGAETNVERRLPLYFLGAFRNEGQGDQRRLELELKLQRGDKALGAKQKGRVPPAETPAELAKLADELADKILASGAGSEFDLKAEAKQLVARANSFEQLGNWKESQAMLETALLLMPNQPAISLRASHLCAVQVRQSLQKAFADPRECMHALNHHRRGLEHLETALRATVKRSPPIPPNSAPYVDPAPTDEFQLATLRIRGLKDHRPLSEERTALFAQVTREEREMYLRLCRVRAAAGTGDEHRFLITAVETLPSAEKYAAMRAMILELKDLPLARERTVAFAMEYRVFVEDPQFPAFVDSLAGIPHPAVRAAGRSIKNSQAALLAKLLKPKEPTLPKKYVDGEVLFHQVNVNMELTKCLAIGPKLDVMLGAWGVFLMKEKGVLVPMWETNDPKERPRRFCYDGRYVWFSVDRLFKTPQLFVLDPVAMKTWEFSAADGLPLIDPKSLPDRNANQIIDMAPLGPGRVCLCGAFGRAWLAIATFDPKAGKTVKVFHEARDAPEAQIADLWTRTTVAFEPAGMFVLTGAQGVRRVLIGRTEPAYEHPLVVDPDALTVEVMQDKVWYQHLQWAHAHDGAVYYIGPIQIRKSKHLIQIAFPGQVRKPLFNGFPDGQCLLVKDEIHVAARGGEWWHGSLAKKEIRPVGKMPTIRDFRILGISSHYGVLICTHEPGTPKIYQVVVTPKKGAE